MGAPWNITRDENEEEVLYTVNWSPWGFMDRWTISRRIPAEAGMFQLWARKSKNFFPLLTEPSYYSGLRNSLREAIDELAPAGRRLRSLMGDQDCRFRFSTHANRNYLAELYDWFREGGGKDAEGRVILVNEEDDLRNFSPPPPEVLKSESKNLKDSNFGPPLPLQIYRHFPDI